MRAETDPLKIIIGLIIIGIVAIIVVNLIFKGGGNFASGIQCEGKGECIQRDTCDDRGGQRSSFTCPGDKKLICCTNTQFGGSP
ncbi:MAG: hypothetical protein QF486_06230 [Candidatus Woesearchaeota archaeon]|jgi:hypothetical protein|nr:hypothetical protein [Candidatus Woesearchaeota archaeon]MDP7180879.1 hypothetical protein [Candidatus Woesearchaeota archaeon]MDP7199183.1 hypothetical protein [Candidatus Woesearchaeota archaeon]MDP7467554.1 hypothetical protein [Candidatus Woesearchaeota archaeon]MDP7647036.1 hypothetical protein [Candidatus Woesearchaeota archaeon]